MGGGGGVSAWSVGDGDVYMCIVLLRLHSTAAPWDYGDLSTGIWASSDLNIGHGSESRKPGGTKIGIVEHDLCSCACAVIARF